MYWQSLIQRDAELSSETMWIAKAYINNGMKEPIDLVMNAEKKYYEEKYNISQYKKQLPICIVATGFNNTKFDRYKFNLNSIFRQQYDNFHVVYVDDASPDRTAKAVNAYMSKMGFNRSKLTLIENT